MIRKTRPLERDLEKVLVGLSDDFPLLATLVERQAGGQRRLPIGRAGDAGSEIVAVGAFPEAGPAQESTPAPPGGSPVAPPATADQADAATAPPPTVLPAPGHRGPRRPAHYALRLQFETRPGDAEVGRLVESTVWVNDAHPAYRRAVASKSEGYHLALTVAMALAPLAVEPAQVHGFVTSFLARWGEAADGAKARRPP